MGRMLALVGPRNKLLSCLVISKKTGLNCPHSDFTFVFKCLISMTEYLQYTPTLNSVSREIEEGFC